MVEQEWGGLEATFVTKLREQKVEPVPEPIVKLAQRSLEGHKLPDGTVMHAMQLKFETAEKAQAFAKHMRNAGPHTNPPSSLAVVVDPQRGKVQLERDGQKVVSDSGKAVMVDGPPVDPTLVAFRAGERRGRKAT